MSNAIPSATLPVQPQSVQPQPGPTPSLGAQPAKRQPPSSGRSANVAAATAGATPPQGASNPALGRLLDITT